jgi:hypothetical protein
MDDSIPSNPPSRPLSAAAGDDLYAATNPDGTPTAEVLKRALKAFKKRLKLTQLDQDSRIGRAPTSGSGKSSVVAIQPPDQYPRAVWDELVKKGKLRTSMHGLYELLEP